MTNFNKTLFLECRGCYFFDNDKIAELSDVGNYRIGAYDNEIKVKNGKSYVIEFVSTTRRALRKTHKKNGKPLKHPVIEITQENALCIDTQFENANGCWADLALEKEIADMNLSYTKADILAEYNKNYWVFRFIASDGDCFEYEYNTNRITG